MMIIMDYDYNEEQYDLGLWDDARFMDGQAKSHGCK